MVVPVAVGAALQRKEAGGHGSLLPHAHWAWCPQVTHWEGTATAGALGAEGQCTASHNPGKGSTVSCEGRAGRSHDPESLREPLQGLSSRLSRNHVHTLMPYGAGSPVIACCTPRALPTSPMAGPGLSCWLPRGDHAQQPLLQLQGDEDAATIHPVSNGAGETPAAGSTPVVPARGRGQGGRARQRHRQGWRQGPKSCRLWDALSQYECTG